MRLGVNIDHVATIRNARGGVHPDPVRAARLACASGADGITVHLREDRRHISDNDIHRLMKEVDLPLNLEMAATGEMLDIAIATKPNAVCLVPEKRAEIKKEWIDYLMYLTLPLFESGWITDKEIPKTYYLFNLANKK